MTLLTSAVFGVIDIETDGKDHPETDPICEFAIVLEKR